MPEPLSLQERPAALDRQKREREQRASLRLKREAKGLTQGQLAKYAGISQSKLSLYESPYHLHINLTSQELKAIKQVLSGKHRKQESGRLSDMASGLSLRLSLVRMERKRRLRDAGMSQQEVAKEMGTYRSKIAEWVSGKVRLTAEEETKLNKILDDARQKKVLSDPYLLLDEAYKSWTEDLANSDKRIALLEQIVESYKRVHVISAELIELLRSEDTEKDEKIARLEEQKKLLVDLLDTETTKAFAGKRTEELRAEIASTNEQ